MQRILGYGLTCVLVVFGNAFFSVPASAYCSSPDSSKPDEVKLYEACKKKEEEEGKERKLNSIKSDLETRTGCHVSRSFGTNNFSIYLCSVGKGQAKHVSFSCDSSSCTIPSYAWEPEPEKKSKGDESEFYRKNRQSFQGHRKLSNTEARQRRQASRRLTKRERPHRHHHCYYDTPLDSLFGIPTCD